MWISIDFFTINHWRRKCFRGRVMRNKSAELLAPTKEGLRTIVRMAYAAGRARGREEAKRELQGHAKPPAASTTQPDNLNDVLGHTLGEAPPPETKLSEAIQLWIAAKVGPNEQSLA
jgi:hypothetical protein